MVLSRIIRRWSRPTKRLLLAASLTLAPAAAARAVEPYIPPDAKGYRAQQIREAYIRQQAAQAQAALSHPAASPARRAGDAAPYQPREDVVIRVMVPTQSVVTLRGPDGTVQTYPLAQGAPGGARRSSSSWGRAGRRPSR